MIWEVKVQGRKVNSMAFLQRQINHKNSLIKCEIIVELAVDHGIRLLSVMCRETTGIRGWEVLCARL